jgi:hypothetical protein
LASLSNFVEKYLVIYEKARANDPMTKGERPGWLAESESHNSLKG